MTITCPRWLNLTLLIFVLVGATVVMCIHQNDLHWRLGLLSHFCMQHLVGLGCLALVALFFRAWKTLVAFLVLMAFCFSPMIPLFFDASRHTFEQDFKAGLINLYGQDTSVDAAMQHAHKHEVDFLLFVGVTPAHLPKLEAQQELYPHQISRVREDAFGVALLSKEAAHSSSITEFAQDGLPSISAKFLVKEQPVTIVMTNERAVDSAQATARRDESLQALATYIKKLPPAENVIVAGNFNLTPFNKIFQHLVNETGLFNSARGFGYQPTWPGWMSISAIPIDHILLSKKLLVADRQVGPSIGAEHYPIWVGLGFDSSKE